MFEQAFNAVNIICIFTSNAFPPVRQGSRDAVVGEVFTVSEPTKVKLVTSLPSSHFKQPRQPKDVAEFVG